LSVFFCIFGIYMCKSCALNVNEIDPRTLISLVDFKLMGVRRGGQEGALDPPGRPK